MKLDPVVKKETCFLVVGECILTALMLAVFLLLRKCDLLVLIGSVLQFIAVVQYVLPTTF